MIVQNVLTLVAFTALSQQALAFNPYRYVLRHAADKRAVRIVTEWETKHVIVHQGAVTPATQAVADGSSANVAQATLTASYASAVALSSSSTSAAAAATQNPYRNGTSSVGGANNSSMPFPSKRGLAYNDVSMANLLGASCPTCSWAYDWAASTTGLSSNLNYVPMLWGDQSDRASTWDSNAEKAIASGSKALFSFNEPDHTGQANLSPQQAAASHTKYMNKYAGRILIGAPAITNSGNANEGIQWLQNFVSVCNSQSEKCHYDFCNVHWYSEAEYASTLFDHLEAANKACGGKPIWLTEFAPTAGDTEGFLRSVVPKLDALGYLHAYSYFMVKTGSLMSSANSISSLGKLYASI
ncbi:hypothetical protein DCS_04644 [Drechmeria coniospora]|uniref:Asl1-like glycosyl hydrolase catalytic domain-containing protein n=1 Tax=Drechmeria coniospora TaxID=98403 RepID=A0A151GKU8_DRECN|nr:hypothetical protein DCS_04644 [Drechmeria coniospora]KYK57632.1 hypothetical protein DCS_04644 [Drechmeria coniospora]ODA79521.1 hypothetical protein RJ55_05114 [Drechmeria coniospora]